MTDVTIKALASEIQTSVDRLIQQFADAGIRKSADDSVTSQEKQTLLTHLNREHGSAPDKLTLQRKTRSTLNIPGTGGKSKSVQIEVRKKRTFVKRDPQEAERLAAEEQAQREAEEQARREAEEAATITSPHHSMLVRLKMITIVKSKAVAAVAVAAKRLVRRRKATNTLNRKLIVKKPARPCAAVKAVSTVKVPLCSRASRSQRRPLTVTS